MTEELEPVVVVAATDRPIQVVELVGVRYRVRRPKSVIESTPKTAILKVAAYFEQDSESAQNRAQRRATKGTKPQRIELSADDYMAGTEAVWQYLQIVLVDPGDYESIRCRVYGDDISDADASAYTYLEVDTDPNPDDDIDTVNIVTLVGNLIALWSAENESVKTNVRPPGPPAPQTKTPGTTTKRTAKRPAKRG